MTTHADLERLVRERARNRCEYCGMHQSLQGGTFHIEHVVPRCRNGLTEEANLAFACPGCNLQKSNRIEVPDLRDRRDHRHGAGDHCGIETQRRATRSHSPG
jgi:5-methylcytosine-specific restriction endonuclease McrA